MREAGLEALSKGNKAALWAQALLSGCTGFAPDDPFLEIMSAILLNGRELNILHVSEGKEEISRRSFLKLGFAGISGATLLLLSGCLSEEDDEDDDDD